MENEESKRTETSTTEHEPITENGEAHQETPVENITSESLDQLLEACRKRLYEEKYDEAIEDYKECLTRGISFYNDELAFPLFKFYLGYGHALLSRLEKNMELFGDVIKKEEEEEDQEEEQEPEIENKEANKVQHEGKMKAF